jgi:hypothetical protein
MLEHILGGLLKINPAKEAILRVVISTTELADLQGQKESIIHSIVEKVIGKCTPILSLPQMDRISVFKDDLVRFLNSAVQLWEDAQKSEFRVVATSVIEDAAVSWGEQDEHCQADVATDTPQESLHQDPVVILFPQVYQHTTNKFTVINHGFALWSDHTIYRLGRREFQIQYKRNREILGGTAGRVRQNALVSSETILIKHFSVAQGRQGCPDPSKS